MYVRDAKNRDEVWLLDHIESMGLDDVSFRSRDYVIAVDEGSNERAGFGRTRIHKSDPEVIELTGIGVVQGWRDQGVGAHVVERLVETAGDEGFDVVYTLTDQAAYLSQFGFEEIEPESLPEPLQERLPEKRETVNEDVVPLALEPDSFVMPDELRERFKVAQPVEAEDEDPPEAAEDFGIDPDEATYKYDTGS